MRFCLAAMVCAVASYSASAEVFLGSFEGDLSSPYTPDWQVQGGNPGAFVSQGATEGSSAVQVTRGPGYGNALFLNGGTPLAADAASHNFLLLDVSAPSDTTTPIWQQVILVMQGDGMGFTSLGSQGLAVGGSVNSVAFDLSGVTLTAGSTWAQLILITQGQNDGGGQIVTTFDNIRFSNVPEPASLALVGLGLAAMTARRRK